MRSLYFLTHAEVEIDPSVPVSDWPLSERGRARHAALSPKLRGVTGIYCSSERKAWDGAEILSAALRIAPRIIETLGENDRSATGYLPREEFERNADAFFSRPDESVRGWETARAAQTRIVAAIDGIVVTDRSDGDIVVVSHGGVGALLCAALGGHDIDRKYNQPAGGGGHVMTVALPGMATDCRWVPFETFRSEAAA
ncbi:phosphoglycerate mutase [Roseivivax halodurans JCM 10272]|uniref:Phosphoglycerate mutase n=1 Tax=Roseivivax halodurans JCM 10272 TaxID=1449350 RepID=X7EJN9_9RHOB|nr:histidine phosphatase family protein [Roseivivax halodurans]ETX16137.1 phosphoglycerate mutase [Roseivivax halodurans JCM 10272]